MANLRPQIDYFWLPSNDFWHTLTGGLHLYVYRVFLTFITCLLSCLPFYHEQYFLLFLFIKWGFALNLRKWNYLVKSFIMDPQRKMIEFSTTRLSSFLQKLSKYKEFSTQTAFWIQSSILHTLYIFISSTAMIVNNWYSISK